MEYSRDNPSPRYRELISLYRKLHEEGAGGIPSRHVFSGQSLRPHLSNIKRLIEETGARTLLDYGSGKGLQYQPAELTLDGGAWPDVQSYWGVEQIYCYDPAYLPLSRLPGWTFDGVICTDVLEHCPEEDIPWILREIFSFARRFVYANIASYPAQKCLPNGENVHCTVRPAQWWMQRISELKPSVRCEVVVTEKMVINGQEKCRFHVIRGQKEAGSPVP